LLISVLSVPLAYVCGTFTPTVFRFCGIHYEKLGSQDLLCLAFALMYIAGYIGMAISAIWCLIDAILRYVHTHQPNHPNWKDLRLR
jgi:hypothetical protein